jgi:thiol-disulfide isomerase/thioredoxin
VRRLPALGLFVLLMAWSTACSGDPSSTGAPRPAANATSVTSLPGTTTELPTTDPDGFDELIGRLRGTPVVVNVWASWCPPCQVETPRLVAAHATYGDRVQFLGVDIMDSRSAAESFIVARSVPYPSVFDPSGAIRDRLGIIGQPGTVFIDATGKVAAAISGEISETDLDANLQLIAG